MHIVIMSNGFLFSGKMRELRRLLSKLAATRTKVSEFIGNNLN